MIVVPYLVGVVTAPLVAAVVKPIVRGTVRATMDIKMQAKKVAAEAREDYAVLAAEARTQAIKS